MFTGLVRANEIMGANVGVAYSAAATLSANRIHDNVTGVVSTVGGNVNGLGFVGMADPNDIYANTTGVLLTGQMQNQHVFDNTTGVSGSGILGGTDAALANLIENNATGVGSFTGTIQFSRIARNDVGIAATNGLIIIHNQVYKNTSIGIAVNADTDVRIVSNTIYSPLGDSIRIDGSSSNIEVRSNIVWSETGYGIYVDNNSQTGFFSDYNDLHATGTGRVAYWTKDFSDILDFQADVAAFDLHSIGRTAVHPQWSEPQFYNRAFDDFRTFDLVAGLRFSSPTVDNADPLTDLGVPPFETNLLVNPGFESGLNNWTANLNAGTKSSSPAPFAGSSYFYAGNIQQGFAEQTVNLLSAGFTTTQLDSQDLVLVFGGRVQSLSETTLDQGQITVVFLDGTGTEIGVGGLGTAANVTDRWELIGGRLHLPVGTRSIKYRFEATLKTGSTNDSFLDGAFAYVLNDTVAPNQGAYGNTVAENPETARAHLYVRFPDLYTDWERDKPRQIRWESYNNLTEQNVRIDLYRDDPVHGPAFLLTIAASTADDGEFNWIPSTSGIAFATYGLRIVVSFVNDNSVIDRSVESFTVPENGDNYWVDDRSNTNDEYTPAAIGSNRNTGKLATAPKPNPVNVLRIYELTSGATLNIDTGLYPLIYTVIATAKADVGLGLDRGFTMRGPTDPARVAEFVTAIPGNANQDLIYLDDADLMQIRFLTLTGGRHGLYATDATNNLTAERLTVRDNAGTGLLLDGNSDFILLKDITADNHAGNADGVGIVGGAGGTIENLTSSNSRYGLFVSAANLTLNGATIYNNRAAGIRQESNTTGTWTDLEVFGNGSGIELQGNLTIANSSVHDNVGNGIDGINSSSILTLQDSAVFGNDNGVLIRRGQITGSRIYGNVRSGVYAPYYPVTLTGNTIYSNNYGVYSEAYVSGTFTIANNLIYDDRQAAIRFSSYGPSAYEVVNNTIFEALADGLYATTSDNIHLRNNIIWVQTGYGLRIGNESQNDFTSDYNLLYATGTGKVGYWQGDRATLTAWQFANFRDGNSLSSDPLFVNATGADGILGAPNLQGLTATFYIGNTLAALAGVPAVTRTDRQVNFEGYGVPDNALPNDNWAGRWTGWLKADVAGSYTIYIDSQGPQRLSIDGSVVIDDAVGASEQSYTFNVAAPGLIPITYEMVDNSSFARARLQWATPQTGGTRELIQPGNLLTSTSSTNGADDNFHLQSLYGSFKPGSGYSNDAASSPAIDRGRPGDSFANEPLANGGYINLGAYGNTATASKSPAQYILVTNPNGGDRLPQKTSYEIRWRSDGFTGNVRLEYSTSGAGGSFQDLAANEPNDGSFTWTISQATYPVSDQYVIRISSVGAPAITDQTDAVFSVIPPISNYYVNDNSTLGDVYTTAVGDDANDGLTPATPKASIRAILETYDLEYTDTIFVDTGYYFLTENILITNPDSGVIIRGPDGVVPLSTFYSDRVLEDNPLAYFRFGEPNGTTATDASGNGLDGTYVNGVTLGIAGALPNSTDTAAQFDGVDDYVDLPDGFADFTNGLTLEIWIYPTQADTYSRLFDFGNGQNSDNIILARRSTTNDLTLQVWNNTTAGAMLTASGVLEFNKWQHFVATIDNTGAAQIFKNGLLVASGNVTAPRNVTRTSNYIARSNWTTPDEYYTGSFDEAAIYDHVLTAQRIATHYYSATGQSAVLDRANSNSGKYVFELDNADAVTLSNLSITGGYDGININHGSILFTLENSTVYNNANAGLNIQDAASANPTIRDSVFYGDLSAGASGDQNYGVYSKGQDPTVLRNQAYHLNGRSSYGIYLDNAGTNVVARDNLLFNNSTTGLTIIAQSFESSGNVAYNNDRGFYYEDTTGSQVATVHDDLAFGNGTGFELRGAGEYYDLNAHDNGTGFYAPNAALTGIVHDITSWANTTGISWNSGTLQNARVFGNTGTGLVLNYGAWTVTGVTAYNNATGIHSQGYHSNNTLANNLVYDNRDRGIWLDDAQSSSGTLFFTNNTVMELNADAVEITGNSQNVQLKNNVLWAGGAGHYVVRVADTAQRGFSSDYNLFRFTDGAQFGFWQSGFATLADWRYELGFDTHSVATDPLFVDPAGADGIRGYQEFAGLMFEYFPNATFNGAPTVTLIDRSISFGSYFGAFRNFAGQPSDNQSFRWSGEIYLSTAGSYTFYINSSGPQRLTLGGNLLIDDFSNPSNTEQHATYTAATPGWVSILYEVVDPAGGSGTQASLDWTTPDNPVRRTVRAEETAYAAGGGAALDHLVLRYQSDTPSYGLDDDFHLSSTAGSWHGGIFAADAVDSPAIDLGDLASPYANESNPNGGRINLGFEGNTEQASRSRSPYLQLLSPNGFEKTRINGGMIIQWRTLGDLPFVDIAVSLDGGAHFTTIAAGETNDGDFAWNPTTASNQALIRISSTLDPSISDTSDNFFTIGAAGTVYYVNDNAQAGDFYSLAVGDNANSGTTPSDPMKSVNAVLGAYDLEPGDIIYVDTGYYPLSTNIRITAADAGVSILGPTTSTGLGAAYESAVLADAPLAYYRLGESSGTIAADASGHGLDASYVNGVSLGGPGALNGSSDTAAQFDGNDDYVDLPDGFADFTNGVTLEIWIYPTANAQWSRLFDLGNGTASDNILLSRYTTNNDLYLQIYNGGSAGGNLRASGILDYNRWQHIVATVDASGNARIYRDGVLWTSGTINAPNNVSRTSSFIGRGNSSDPYFAGGLDEAAVYNYVLPVDRIAQHYFAGIGQGAVLDRANTSSGAFAFELNNADNVRFDYLGITGGYDGINVSNGSANFTLQHSRVFNNANSGLNIQDAASANPVLTDNEFYGDLALGSGSDQNYGVFSRGLDPTVLRNRAYHLNGSTGYGIDLENAGTNVLVQDNVVFNNSNAGLSVSASAFDITGNVAFDNGTGFDFNDTTAPLVGQSHDNVAYNNSTGFRLAGSGEFYHEMAHDNGAGFLVSNGALDGVVHDITSWHNTTGINWNSGTLRNARVYGNLGTGIYLGYGNWTVTNNVVYDNYTGIHSQGYHSNNTLANNLVYDNRDRGILLDDVQTSSGTLFVTNNTVMELDADVIQITGNSQNVQLRNNVLWSGGAGHYVLNVANTAQRSFSSDYNLLYFTDGAKLAYWQNDFNTLADWRYELGFDLNSLNTDPLFVDPDGADNVRGYQDYTGLQFEYFANGTGDFGGTPAVTLIDRSVNFSSTNSAFRGLAGQPSDNQSYRWTGEIYLPVAGTYNFWITSQGPQRLTIDGTPIIDDYSLSASTGVEQTGAYTAAGAGWVSLSYEVVDPASGGATMARLEWSTPDLPQRRVIRAVEALPGTPERVVLRYNTAAATTGVDDNFHLQSSYGSYRPATMSFVNDALSSPAIDAGDLTSAYANELAPNGGRINLGYEGNTAEASHSSDQILQLLSFIGGEKVRQGEASLIRWRSSGIGAVDLWFSANSGATWTLLADDEPNDGVFAWNPATSTLHGRLRISAGTVTDFNSPDAVFDVSEADFTVGAAGNLYYVNDALTAGDQYTTAIGDNANSGTTPADPMSSLNAVLNVYDLGAGDVIYVDTGYYPLPTNVRITASDSGVTVQGPTTNVSGSSNYPQVVLDDAPVFYYRLDESSGTTAVDLSGNNNAGTYVNGVQLGQPGALTNNTAIGLDGVNDYVLLPDGFNSFANGFSFEFWAYPTSTGSYQRFLDLGAGQAANNIIVYRRSTTTDLAVNVYNGSTASSEVVASGVLELNRWQHFAITMDPSGLARIYKDGVLVASGQTGVPNDVNRTSNFVGRSNWSTDANYAGGLDEVALYDHVLSAERVAIHYGVATAQGALLDRINVVTGRYALELASAQNVTVRNLGFTGGEWGFVANNADGLRLYDSLAFNNAAGGFYVNTDVADVVVSGNEAYGRTGNSNKDQNIGFQLRGDQMVIVNNRAYKVGAQLGDGIDVDSADDLVFHDNLAYNNVNGISISTSQGDVYANEARDNDRGIYVDDSNGNARTQVHDNFSHDNDAQGFYLDDNVEAYNNTAQLNGGDGFFINNDNTLVRNNYSQQNATGIHARYGQVIQNRVVGNTGAGIYTDYTGVFISGNSVYGNTRGHRDHQLHRRFHRAKQPGL